MATELKEFSRALGYRSSILKRAGYILMFFLAASLLFAAAGKSVALAQNANEPTGFKNVKLWIYPEYDDPRLLVMLEGQIAGVPAPAEVRFLVPSAAEMYSAGSIDAQGKYSGGPPQRESSSIPGWDEISYEVTTDIFRVEYYDPIIFGQPDKTISYEFRWLYPIADLEVVVQEPRHASNFSVVPAGQAFVDSEGFNSYRYNYSGLNDGPPLHFEIAYTKSDTNPSLAVGGSGTSSSSLVVIIAVVLVVLAAGGFFWLRRPRPKTRAARRQSARDAAARVAKGNKPKARFCSQCGQPIEGSERFCPYCGAKL